MRIVPVCKWVIEIRQDTRRGRVGSRLLDSFLWGLFFVTGHLRTETSTAKTEAT